MALSQSVVSELLDAFRAGEGVDLIRDAVQLVLQELIEVEATEQIGAGRYERTDTRVTERNGRRPRLLATQAGDVELRIPKLRKGSFFPSILEPRRRIDQALYAVVMEAYVNGVSTRCGRRPGRRAGCRLGDLQVRGVPDLRRARRDRRRVPHPPSRSHRVPLRLSRRHLPARPQPDLAGHLDGGRGRHRHHRRR